ncbi:Gag-Pro-Pol poly [Paramuricea clavata]|uniref:Gag-Pro-Pol poly n=1 Tax=Paramuricea clavata TaxID=317549 RepID=A0A6S7FTR9_PARCT|nr:Gag-Pro-Pol poly [Paramuricea clavata]
MEEMAIIATNITEAKQKRALLLHYAGPAVDKIFDTLSDTGEDKDYKEAVDALNAYFLPQVNSTFKEYNFRQAKQQHGENIDAYNTRLRQLAILPTSIKNKAKETRETEKITENINNRSPDTLGTLEINKKNPGNRQFPTRNRQIPPGNQQIPTQKCRNCGGIFPHNGDCPAKGKECRACGKSGHFAKVCRSKPNRREIHQVSETPSEEPEYLFTVQNNHQHNTSPLCEVHIANEPVQTIIDSGASVNIIDESTYEKIRKYNQSAVLTTSQSKIYTYGSNMELTLLGMTTAEIRFRSTTVTATFYVTKGRNGNLLS